MMGTWRIGRIWQAYQNMISGQVTSAWRLRACWLKDSSSFHQPDASNGGWLSELLQQEYRIEQVDQSGPRGP